MGSLDDERFPFPFPRPKKRACTDDCGIPGGVVMFTYNNRLTLYPLCVWLRICSGACDGRLFLHVRRVFKGVPIHMYTYMHVPRQLISPPSSSSIPSRATLRNISLVGDFQVSEPKQLNSRGNREKMCHKYNCHLIRESYRRFAL